MISRGRCLLVWLCAALLVYGCGTNHIRTLREAQDTFNQAADRHNRDALSAQEPLTASSAEAVSGFRIAAGLAGSLIEKNRDDLLKDNLLCTAFVIQAMALWKVGDHDTAVNVARGSDNCAPSDKARAQLARERATLAAIPALVRIDQANALVTNGRLSVDEYVTARKEIELAIPELRDAERLVSADHPVHGYLIVSRLAAMRVWHSGTAYKGLTDKTDPARTAERNAASAAAGGEIRVLQHYLVCAARRTEDDARKLSEGWQRVFGITLDLKVSCEKPISADGKQ